MAQCQKTLLGGAMRHAADRWRIGRGKKHYLVMSVFLSDDETGVKQRLHWRLNRQIPQCVSSQGILGNMLRFGVLIPWVEQHPGGGHRCVQRHLVTNPWLVYLLGYLDPHWNGGVLVHAPVKFALPVKWFPIGGWQRVDDKNKYWFANFNI